MKRVSVSRFCSQASVRGQVKQGAVARQVVCHQVFTSVKRATGCLKSIKARKMNSLLSYQQWTRPVGLKLRRRPLNKHTACDWLSAV